MFSKLAIALAILSCLHSSASASVIVSPSVKYRVSPVKQINGKKVSKDILIQKVQLDAASGISNNAIKAINLELARAVKAFKRDADECHSYAEGNPWGYESRIEKIMLTKKYISFVFARATVCAGSPDFEKDPLVFSTKDGKVVSVAELFENTFPGRTVPEVRDYNKRRIGLSAEMARALLHDSQAALKDVPEECAFFLKGASYMAWMEDKGMALVPEFIQAESICQKEYVINLALAATPGIKYDKKSRTISLTVDGQTVVLERLAEDEAPELVGMDEYIRILPDELQPYRDRGILLLNTTASSRCANGPGQCDRDYEMYLHAVDIDHGPPRQVSKVPLVSCPMRVQPDELNRGTGDFSAFVVDDHEKLNVFSCGRSATLSDDLSKLKFDE